MTNARTSHATSPSSQSRRPGKQLRKCPQCGLTFSKTEHLERHVRSHTRERPFECDLCGKTYTRHDSLLRHTRGHLDRESEPRMRDSQGIISPPESGGDRAASIVDKAQERSLSGESPLQCHTSDNIVASADFHPGMSVEQGSTTAQVCVSASQSISTQELGSSCLTDFTGTGQYAASGYGDALGDLVSDPSDLSFQELGWNAYDPAWLLGNDFDIDALGTSISAVMPDWGPRPTTEFTEHRRQYPVAKTPNQLCAPSPSIATVSLVQQKWHTRVSRAPTPSTSSSQLPDQDFVDERYREGLFHRLQPRAMSTVLPSADFLNLCIKLYLTKFNPVFPIIHVPTFRPSSERALLLLSICSVGALFVGSVDAAAQGRKIFPDIEQGNSRILGELYPPGRSGAVVAGAGCHIGQTFGMLSGHPQDLRMTESFNGTVIAWARQAGLFRIKNSLTVFDEHSVTDSDAAWKNWAQAEESVRLVLGLHIHDMEFAISFHHEPLLRHSVERLPVCCPDELFTAFSAAQWHSLMKNRRESSSAALSCFADSTGNIDLASLRCHMFPYSSLSCIISSIQEAKTSTPTGNTIQQFRARLLKWQDEYCMLLKEVRSNAMNLEVLWHMAFMWLYTDMDLLERALGRDGSFSSKQANSRIRTWVSTSEARRAVLHALLVVKQVESIPIAVEPAIHVPKVLFYAALILHSYTTLAPSPHPCGPLQDETSQLEFLVEISAHSSHHNGGHSWLLLLGRMDSSILCSAIDLLRRLSHWGISQRYAGILENLLGEFAKP